MNKLLSPYLRRLRLNAALQALAGGAAIGLSAGAIGLLLCRLLRSEAIPARVSVPAIAGLCFAAAVLLYALRLRPTPETAARKLDALGLQERVGTMLALAGSEVYLHTVQRADAERALAAVSPKQLRLHIPRAPLLLCAAALAACLLTGLLPQGLLVPKQAAPVRTAEQDTVAQMLSDLRRRVEASDLSEAEKAELLAQIAALEASVEAGELSMLQLLAQTAQTEERAKREIAESLESSPAEGPDGTAVQPGVLDALMEYPVLQELCRAIRAMDDSGVRRACNALTARLLTPTGDARKAAVMDLYGYLDAVLRKAKETDTDGYLLPILRLLAGSLLEAAQPDVTEEQCAARVADALRAFAVNLCDSFTDTQTVQNANGADGGEDSAQAASGEGEGQSGKRSAGGGEGSGALRLGNGYQVYGGKGVTGLPLPAGTAADDSEPMYEPTLGGQIPYGSMYGVYYARMLELLTRDEALPEDARNALELYFSDL